MIDNFTIKKRMDHQDHTSYNDEYLTGNDADQFWADYDDRRHTDFNDIPCPEGSVHSVVFITNSEEVDEETELESE